MQSPLNLDDVLELLGSARAEGGDAVHHLRAHAGEVRHRHGEGLSAQLTRADPVAPEVDVLDDGVDADRQVVAGRRTPYGGIVAVAILPSRPGAGLRDLDQPLQQGALPHLRQGGSARAEPVT
jgi:hypothetical protein